MNRDQFRGTLVGMAVGDAVGVPLEFTKGRKAGAAWLVDDMIGGGVFHLPVGAWTDDTSMGLCLAVSLVERGGMDSADQLARYDRWITKGYLSSIGRCFDVGGACRAGVSEWKRTKQVERPFGTVAGNGALMRCAPAAMYYADWSEDFCASMTGVTALTTHNSYEAIETCEAFGAMIWRALHGQSQAQVLDWADNPLSANYEPTVQRVLAGSYKAANVAARGWTVATLEAAMWAFWAHKDYRSTVLGAVNLGDDADTVGAVTGALAGAYYGYSGIPLKWLESLVWHDWIVKLADAIYDQIESEA